MYEAVALVCALASGAESCRDVLLPGHAGAMAEACAASVEAAPPGWLAGVDARGVDCRPRPAPEIRAMFTDASQQRSDVEATEA